jgi:hypothetical protein
MADNSPIGAQIIAGGDHLLIPSASQNAYAQTRVTRINPCKVRLGSLR